MSEDNRVEQPDEALYRRTEILFSQEVEDIRKLSADDIHELTDKLTALHMAREMRIDRLLTVQDELQVSRDRYQDLFDTAPMGYLTLDKNGLILEANITIAGMLGIERGELIGSPFVNYIASDSQDTFFSHVRKAFETNTRQSCELKAQKKDGSPFHIRLEGIPERDSKGNLSQCRVAVIDITERKKTEEVIRFQAIIAEVAPDAIIAADKDINVTSWNKTAEAIYGLRADEVLGKRFSSLLNIDYLEGLSRDEVVRQVRENGFWIGEAITQKKDGSKVAALVSFGALRDSAGNFNGMVGIHHNITDRKRIEEALRISEQRYRNLVESTTDFIWEVDNKGEYIYASPTIYQILGYNPEEILGKTPFDLMPPEETGRIEKVFQQIAAQEKPFSSLENINLHKDGHPVVLETSGVPFYNAEGIFCGYRGIDRDITERKRMQEALAKAKDELEIKIKERTDELLKANIELGLRAKILDMAYDTLLIYSPDAKLLYANEAAARLYRYTKEEFNHFKVSQLIPPQGLDAYKNRIRTVLEKGEISAEVYHQRKDGSPVPVETHSRLIETEGRKYIISIIRDITGRKQTEEQIKRNELQLQSIFNALTEGVALIAPDGTVVQANKSEARILGLESLEEHVGKHFGNPNIKHIYPDGTPLPIEESAVTNAIKRKRNIRNFEVGLVKEDGSTLWINANAIPIIDESGKVVSVVRTIADITEQKKLMDERDQFTRRLLEVQEEERKRISRELHDDTAQFLALLNLEIDSIIEKGKQLPPETISHLQKLRGTAERALQEVRRFSHELRPSVLEHFGLTAALELIISEFNATCQTQINLKISGSERRLQDETELVLFRITQEAMSNIRKHSEASRAELNLKFTPDKVRLTIADNGKGFTIGRKSQPIRNGHLGLIGMRERAHLIGATLKIKSRPDKGTVISVELNIH